MGDTFLQTAIETDAVLTDVISGDPETQFMALVRTRSAKSVGEALGTLLCSAGGDLVLAEAPESEIAPLQLQGATAQGDLKTLITEGVQVDIWAIFLPNRTFGKEALIEDVSVVKPDDIGNLIICLGIRILSF
jgi:hypothetical protein